MIDISSLEQYFPQINKPVIFEEYTFTIVFRQEKDAYVINLKIKQQDNKEEHLISFRFGIGKDKPQQESSHKSDAPHFEIDIYRRAKEAFSATIYFTFQDDENIFEYAKGTVSLINKIIKQFVKNERIDKEIIKKIIYADAVAEELARFEPVLIDALYECYKNSDLIVREGTNRVVIKTLHNFRKYLGADSVITDLDPIVQPLLERIEKKL